MGFLSVSKKGASSFITQYGFLIICIFLTLVKVWLTRSQPLYAIGSSIHDDRLYLTLASHILKGEWLGPYDALTLIKGPFYPIWIALNNILGLPLLLSQQILYAFSCFILSNSLQPLIKSKLNVAIVYILLLFNPVSFDAFLTRPLRDFIYTSLSLVITGCAVRLLTSQIEVKSTNYWALGLGVSFACFWLTREEALWIVPLLLILFIASLFLFLQQNNWKIKGLSVILKPWSISIIVFLLLLNTIKYMNFINYGAFAKTEFDLQSTQAAYGALTRVKPVEIKKYVPVTRETMHEIYQVSPAFAELSSYFDGYMGRVFWPEQGNSAGRDATNRTEILGGWFFWAFRDAIANAGYYSNGKYPENYYQRVAAEINLACESGKLNCYNERTTLMPVLHMYYLKYMIPFSLERIMELVKFESIYVFPRTSRVSEEEFIFFQTLTNEKIYLQDQAHLEYSYSANDQTNIFRATVLDGVLKTHRLIFPSLFFIAIIGFVIILSQWIKKRQEFIQITILLSLAAAIITRSALLSLLDLTTLDISAGVYLHPLYPMMALFIILTLIECTKYLPASFVRLRRI